MTTKPIKEPKTLSPPMMLFMGFIVGVVAGFGSIAFRMMIGFFHNLLFYGKFDLLFNANTHTPPSTWGIGIVLVPVIGAIAVTWLVKTFAPEAKGHGVPEVIDAIFHKEGKIRPIVAVCKSLASAISIGSGGSVGREGPIIQIGAAFGSTLGQIFRMPTHQIVLLIAAGAGAGIASTFNAPIGGIAFAVELLLISINATTLSVVAISTITATFIGRMFIGLHPAFYDNTLTLPLQHLIKPEILLLCIPFAVIIGAASWLFIRMIYWLEDAFNQLPFNDYFKHMLGMLGVGLLMYAFMSVAGHYYVEGVGYSTIMDILNFLLRHPWLLLILFVGKLLATGLTLGSGASGGVFSPSLFLGATVGALFGLFCHWLFPSLDQSNVVIIFAIAGMAGMVSSSTGAVLTAIIMLFEMTHDYSAILPIVITSTIACIVRASITHENIYTLKLSRRGKIVSQGLHAAVHAAQKVKHVLYTNIQITTLPDLVNSAELETVENLVVIEEEEIKGVITPATNNTIESNFIYVTSETNLETLVQHMHQQKIKTAIVMKNIRSRDPNDIVGIVDQNAINSAMQKALYLTT